MLQLPFGVPRDQDGKRNSELEIANREKGGILEGRPFLTIASARRDRSGLRASPAGPYLFIGGWGDGDWPGD